jgi:tetratricopeptide (TPR) repeat protein
LGDAPAALDAAHLTQRYYLRFSNDTHLRSSIHFQIGRSEHLAGNLDKAAEHLAETVRLCRQYGPDWGVSIAMTELGMVVEAQEDLMGALDYYNQALINSVPVTDWWNYQRARTNVSRIQVTLGNYPEAITLTLAILQTLLQYPAYGLEVECFIVVARILKHTGDTPTAIAILRYCAAHLECDQLTRDRAKSYLDSFTDQTVNATFASVTLPATKLELSALLIEHLTRLQDSVSEGDMA